MVQRFNRRSHRITVLAAFKQTTRWACDKRAQRVEWRGQDLNLRPRGYEPRELPDCSTPRQHHPVGMRCGPVLYRPLNDSSRVGVGNFSAIPPGYPRQDAGKRKELQNGRGQNDRIQQLPADPCSSAVRPEPHPSTVGGSSGFFPPPGIRRSRIPLTNCDDWAVP